MLVMPSTTNAVVRYDAFRVVLRAFVTRPTKCVVVAVFARSYHVGCTVVGLREVVPHGDLFLLNVAVLGGADVLLAEATAHLLAPSCGCKLNRGERRATADAIVPG